MPESELLFVWTSVRKLVYHFISCPARVFLQKSHKNSTFCSRSGRIFHDREPGRDSRDSRDSREYLSYFSLKRKKRNPYRTDLLPAGQPGSGIERIPFCFYDDVFQAFLIRQWLLPALPFTLIKYRRICSSGQWYFSLPTSQTAWRSINDILSRPSRFWALLRKCGHCCFQRKTSDLLSAFSSGRRRSHSAVVTFLPYCSSVASLFENSGDLFLFWQLRRFAFRK